MPLRSRLLLVFGIALAALLAAVLGAVALTGHLDGQLRDGLLAQGQHAGWQREVALHRKLLGLGADRMAGDPAPLLAGLSDPAGPASTARYGASRVEVLDGAGELMHRDGGALVASSILEAEAAKEVLSGQAVGGIAQDAGRRYVLFEARAFTPESGMAGAVILATELPTLMASFSAIAGGPAMLVDLRGRPIGTADPQFRAVIADGLPPLHRPASDVLVDGRRLHLVATPVEDGAGRTIARLLTLRPAPSALGGWSGWLGAAVALVGALGAMLTLRRYLGTATEPTVQLVNVAEQLAAGTTNVEIGDVGEPDADRLVDALRQLRRRLMLLHTLEVSHDKQGRRQQRFIRAQMMTLAETLEPWAREIVRQDLERLEKGAPADAPSRAAAGPSDFSVLAAAFQNMAMRIREQYERLGSVIEELNEALKSKSQFQLLQQELETARSIQLSVLPRQSLEQDGAVIHGMMMPAREVGGDFYDFFSIDSHRIGVVVADVSGKGVPAAFFMLITRTLLKATALFGISPAQCLCKLNDLLAAENEQMMFVTVIYGVLDLRDGRFTFANAGHNAPVLVRGNGTTELLDARLGMALAVMEEQDYEEKTVELDAGDMLILYTDGITEAFDPSGEAFGNARLLDLAEIHARARSWQVPNALVGAIKTFEAGGEQADDITCVAIGFQRD